MVMVGLMHRVNTHLIKIRDIAAYYMLYHISVKAAMDLLDVDEKDVMINAPKRTMELKTRDGEIINVPLDSNNQLIINWRDKWGKAFRHFSYIDVISSYRALADGK